MGGVYLRKINSRIVMRLGQLARKLMLSPAEIIDYLALHGIAAEEGVNTRLDAGQTARVVQHFSPGTEIAASGETEAEPLLAAEPLEPTPSPPAVEEVPPAVPQSSEEMQPRGEIDVEVIKAPKVTLAGLKVVGKIDLPEPKKKQDVPPADAPEAGTTPKDSTPRKPRREERGNSAKRNNNNSRTRNNPVALQREREAKEAEERRAEQQRQQKEKRKEYYQQRVVNAGPTKAARLYDEPVVEVKADLTKEPTTWLGKFWKWYRS